MSYCSSQQLQVSNRVIRDTRRKNKELINQFIFYKTVGRTKCTITCLMYYASRNTRYHCRLGCHAMWRSVVWPFVTSFTTSAFFSCK